LAGAFSFRTNSSSTLFPNFYQRIPAQQHVGVTTNNVPHECKFFIPSLGKRPDVQDSTTDLTGSGIAGDNARISTRSTITLLTRSFGSHDHLRQPIWRDRRGAGRQNRDGGPTKQMLNQTGPGILNLEFMADHYGIDGSGSGRFPVMRNAAARSRFHQLFGRTHSNLSRAWQNGAQINQVP